MIDTMNSICYVMKVALRAVSARGHQMEAERHIFGNSQIEAPGDLCMEWVTCKPNILFFMQCTM